jgi:hypothetical protein
MFVPITSEVTLNKGMVLMEIATDRLFTLGQRLSNNPEVWGDDSWELTEINPDTTSSSVAVRLSYLDLAKKYLAEVEE